MTLDLAAAVRRPAPDHGHACPALQRCTRLAALTPDVGDLVPQRRSAASSTADAASSASRPGCRSAARDRRAARPRGARADRARRRRRRDPQRVLDLEGCVTARTGDAGAGRDDDGVGQERLDRHARAERARRDQPAGDGVGVDAAPGACPAAPRPRRRIAGAGGGRARPRPRPCAAGRTGLNHDQPARPDEDGDDRSPGRQQPRTAAHGGRARGGAAERAAAAPRAGDGRRGAEASPVPGSSAGPVRPCRRSSIRRRRRPRASRRSTSGPIMVTSPAPTVSTRSPGRDAARPPSAGDRRPGRRRSATSASGGRRATASADQRAGDARARGPRGRRRRP